MISTGIDNRPPLDCIEHNGGVDLIVLGFGAGSTRVSAWADVVQLAIAQSLL
mgnify:CR=1 FL=1